MFSASLLTLGKCVNDVTHFKSYVTLFQLQKLNLVDCKSLMR